MKVLDKNSFCLYKDREIGIVDGGFAGEMFKSKPGDEYITEVSGRSIFWIDNQGNEYKDDKRFMTRPSEDQIIESLNRYPELKYIAISRKLITID